MYLLQPFLAESRWERAALIPCDPSAGAQTLLEALDRGGPPFVRFLLDFDLGALWHLSLEQAGLGASLDPATASHFRAARMAAAARYMAQTEALRRIDRVFSDGGIAYAVMKGAAIREQVVADPSVLAAGDVDVLVLPAERVKAAALLVEAGFRMRLNPDNISHEVLLQSAGADVDLHWHILRPGRTRVELTGELLGRRVRRDGFWTLSDRDSTFLMLTHPAFAKYVCSPHMGLARVMSFLLWHKRLDAHWNGVVEMLERTGLKTAAWAVLRWYGALAPLAFEEDLAKRREALRPGRVRAAYVNFWLRHNLPSRLIDRAPAIQFGLIAFLHDAPSDALAAYRGWYGARRDRASDVREFVAAVGVPT
ncbi:MAG: nucleotidyltransferase family protein [Telluria sp.]|nr:nucleotidyltransferase family protein [Telluria sp.]